MFFNNVVVSFNFQKSTKDILNLERMYEMSFFFKYFFFGSRAVICYKCVYLFLFKFYIFYSPRKIHNIYFLIRRKTNFYRCRMLNLNDFFRRV